MTRIYYEDLDEADSETHPPKPLKITYNGISVRISVCEIPLHDKESGTKIPTRFITLTVSAKLLKRAYFQGISKHTIKAVYEEFMAFGVFECSLQTFLNGIVCDIDICFNRYCDNEAIFMDAVQTLYNQTGDKAKWLKIIDEPMNKGLQFQKREWATPATPHLKLYHKELELYSKSAEFWNAYLFPEFGNAVKGLTRVEATIKNYKHKQRLEKYAIIDKFRTLEELLEIPEKQLYDVIIFSIDSYIAKKPRVKAPNLSPSDHMLFECIQIAIMAGYDYKLLLERLTVEFQGSSPESTKVSRSRMKTKITELYDLLIHKDLKVQGQARHNEHVLTYLDFVGLKL